MSSADRSPHDDEVIHLNVIETLRREWRRLLIATGVVAFVVAAVGAVYLIWLQPSVRAASLEFRPSFGTAAEGQYPNGLPFSPADIIAPSVMDEVSQSADLSERCDADAVRRGMFVERQSIELQLLDAEFRSRLGETGLSAAQSEQLMMQYQARRSALPLQFRLVFLVPDSCDGMPDVMIEKVLNDTLMTWAQQSEARRGVLKMRTHVLSPNVLEVGLTDSRARLIRADLVRAALGRLADNVAVVEDMPGAALVRLGDERITFPEIRTKLEDLMQSRLEPMIVAAGRALGPDSLAWVEQALASARLEQRAADGRSRAYLDALREYSGTTQTPDTGVGQASPGSSDVQSLAPQIDRTFIDRIIDMSTENITFRQEMTTSMVQENVRSVESQRKVEYYEQLAAALRRPASQSMTVPEVEAELARIISDGKTLADQFNKLYDELSRVSLRPDAGLYHVTSPPDVTVAREFTRRDWLVLILGSAISAFFVALVVFIIAARFSASAAADRARVSGIPEQPRS